MISIVLTEPFVATVEDTPDPEPQPGTALLRLTYGGVCGSDLASYRGTSPYVSYPRVIGHEFAADVVRVDGPADDLEPGMPVTALPYVNCGHCYACRRAHPNACRNNQTMGVQRDGAFSDYVVLPTSRIFAGSGIDHRALALIEPFSISYHGVRRAHVRPGERVLVLGAGAIGILAAVAAKSMGASAYIADIAPEKVESAVRDFGLDGGLFSGDPGEFAAQITDLTDDDGFDVTVEAAGAASAFRTAVEAAASLGRVVVIGVSTQSAAFNATWIQKKELTIVGSRAATADDFDSTIRLTREGFIDLTRLISREFVATDAVAAFDELHRDSASITKALFRF